MRRTTRLRLRRGLRNTRRQVDVAQSQAAEHLEKHVVKRWQKFSDVKRFVFGWLVLIGILLLGITIQSRTLTHYYKVEVPADGGTYTEGVVGEIRNLNPMFASSAPDRTAASLIFDPLMRYNKDMQLTGGLAETWKASKSQTVYTLKLKDNLFWHDGRPIIASDVVFTFSAIGHPDTGSPYERSWAGVKIEAKDEKTVVFTLPNPFTPFLHGLTRVGVVPSHVLEEVPLTELRAHPFNLAPRVGSGPFVFANINLQDSVGQIRLTKYDRYHTGAARLNEFIIQTFTDHEQLVSAINDNVVTGASDLKLANANLLEESNGVNIHTPKLFKNVLVFFNNSQAPFDDPNFRQAIIQATNTRDIFNVLSGSYALSDSALLKDQLGYTPRFTQPEFDQKKAAKLLDELGWKMRDGIRYKGKKTLEFTLVTQNSDEYPVVAEELQSQWRELGIILNLQVSSSDSLQQDHILPHSYDMILLGIDQGVDPDVFVYWHSTEARPGGLNFSEYRDALADSSLEAGRTRSSTRLRTAKYQAFLKQWSADTPAVALYRPNFYYAQLKVVGSDVVNQMADPTDRLIGVTEWTVLTEMVNRPI